MPEEPFSVFIPGLPSGTHTTVTQLAQQLDDLNLLSPHLLSVILRDADHITVTSFQRLNEVPQATRQHCVELCLSTTTPQDRPPIAHATHAESIIKGFIKTREIPGVALTITYDNVGRLLEQIAGNNHLAAMPMIASPSIELMVGYTLSAGRKGL